MKLKFIILVTTIFIFIVRFFCGVYVHDEFAETNFFIKHRPTWKWKFYSPQGMSDTKFEELTQEQQIEQKYWNDFIAGRQPL